MHPAKDAFGDANFNIREEIIYNEKYATPQATNLYEMLDDAFADPEKPNVEELKRILVAIIESGQRHTGHGTSATQHPKIGVHACARQGKNAEGKAYFYCRYGYPKDLCFSDGYVADDEHRKDLRNVFLRRNDPIINSFEEHLLLMNLGNIDWRPLINLWSVLEYLTKYNAKAGKGSKFLGKLFEDVLAMIYKHEEEDGLHDLFRKTVMKFYSRVLGDRDYSVFEVVHFGMGLPGVLSSFGNVEKASVSNWASLKRRTDIENLSSSDRVTNPSMLETNQCAVSSNYLVVSMSWT